MKAERPVAKVAPAIRVELPGGAVLTRPKGASGGPLTCSRCHRQSGPASVDTLAAVETWTKKHHGSECQP